MPCACCTRRSPAMRSPAPRSPSAAAPEGPGYDAYHASRQASQQEAEAMRHQQAWQEAGKQGRLQLPGEPAGDARPFKHLRHLQQKLQQQQQQQAQPINADMISRTAQEVTDRVSRPGRVVDAARWPHSLQCQACQSHSSCTAGPVQLRNRSPCLRPASAAGPHPKALSRAHQQQRLRGFGCASSRCACCHCNAHAAVPGGAAGPQLSSAGPGSPAQQQPQGRAAPQQAAWSAAAPAERQRNLRSCACSCCQAHTAATGAVWQRLAVEELFS
jgi:hypothetical protein